MKLLGINTLHKRDKVQWRYQSKRPEDKNGSNEVKMALRLFTNDTPSFDNSGYHVYVYNTHMVIMHAYEVQMHYVVCKVL